MAIPQYIYMDGYIHPETWAPIQNPVPLVLKQGFVLSCVRVLLLQYSVCLALLRCRGRTDWPGNGSIWGRGTDVEGDDDDDDDDDDDNTNLRWHLVRQGNLGQAISSMATHT